MQKLFAAVAVIVLGFTSRVTSEPPKEDNPTFDEGFHPREVAAGDFEKWQKESEKSTRASGIYSKVEYAGRPFWVVDFHYGYGVPYKKIAVYAPNKDGSFQRVLLADSNRAGHLFITVDHKSGILEMREKANSELKGEVILSCNLKSVGSTYSTSEQK